MGIKNNLLEGEVIVYQFFPHWIIFLRCFLWLLLTLVILLFGPFYALSRFQFGDGPSVYQCVASITFIVGFYFSLKTFVAFACSSFILTNKRVITLQGFFRQFSVEIALSKIARMEISQSLLGQIFNYGDLCIGSKINKVEFALLPYPQWVRELLQEQIENSAETMARQKESLHSQQNQLKPQPLTSDTVLSSTRSI